MRDVRVRVRSNTKNLPGPGDSVALCDAFSATRAASVGDVGMRSYGVGPVFVWCM